METLESRVVLSLSGDLGCWSSNEPGDVPAQVSSESHQVRVSGESVTVNPIAWQMAEGEGHHSDDNSTPTVELTSNRSDHVLVGSVVEYKATGSGGSGEFEFRFLRRTEFTEWQVVRDYAADRVWTWNTLGAGIDLYYVQVHIRNAHSDSDWQAGAALTQIVAAVEPATGASLTTNHPGLVEAGDSVPFSAGGLGGDGEYEFRFWYRPQEGEWQSTREFSRDPNWTWNTSGMAAGTYYIQVYVRSSGSPAAWEAGASLTQELAPAATGAVLTSNLADRVAPGSVIEYTAQGNGGIGSYQYRFLRRTTDTEWKVVRGYLANPKWTWSTTDSEEALYFVQVHVRNSG